MITSGAKYPAGSSVDLNMRVLFVHGDEVFDLTPVY
jgi:hypothetical protein